MTKAALKPFPFNNDELLSMGTNVLTKMSDNVKASARVGIATFYLVKEDGSYVSCERRGCHIALKSYTRRENIYVACVNLLNMTKPMFEEFKEYYRYLLNDSPYSSAYVSKDVDKIYEEGVVLTTNVYRNFFFFANVALRMPWEKPIRVKQFLELTKKHKDFNKDMAYLLHMSYHIESETDYKKGTYTGHTPLATGCMTKQGFKNFLTHTPGGSIRSTYWNNHNYGQANQSWNHKSKGDTQVFDFDTSNITCALIDPWGFITREQRPPQNIVEWAQGKEKEILS